MATSGDRLRAAREKAGRSEHEVANEAGLKSATYYDLETGDELFMTISLEELRGICTSLNVQARDLFVDTTRECRAGSVSFDSLAARLKAYLVDHNMSLSHFEESVGWNLQAFIRSPEAAWQWNVDCLRNVCRPLGLDWLTALPA